MPFFAVSPVSLALPACNAPPKAANPEAVASACELRMGRLPLNGPMSHFRSAFSEMPEVAFTVPVIQDGE
jgi:hypothetical protein